MSHLILLRVIYGCYNALGYLYSIPGYQERESGSQAEMGVASAGKAEEGHNAGEQGGLCAEHNAEGQPLHLCALEPGPEGQDATNRLLETGGQGLATGSGHGDPVQGDSTGEHGWGEVGEEPRVLKARAVRESVPY